MAQRRPDRPMSRAEFEELFPDERACVEYLAEKRWPHGFVCPDPKCQGRKAWEIREENGLWECARCGRQTSVKAGTVLHRSKLPLRTWFLAVHIVTSHSKGISALQLQGQLGLGSYKTAWLMLRKLRRAMVDPDREPLAGVVEVDETTIPLRTQDDPVAGGQGRSHFGKVAIVGAVEIEDRRYPGRIRLQRIPAYDADTLGGFVEEQIRPKSVVVTDGLPAYRAIAGEYEHVPKVVGKMAAHVVLPWVHRVFSNMKRWAMGVFHGIRGPHLQAHLDEFVFRWNRRRWRRASFDTLLGLSMRLPHAGLRDFVPGHG